MPQKVSPAGAGFDDIEERNAPAIDNPAEQGTPGKYSVGDDGSKSPLSRVSRTSVGKLASKHVQMFINPADRAKMRLMKALMFVFIYVGIGVVFYMQFERWTLVDAIYFVFVTITTVGYGDLLPSTPITKLFTCMYAFLGIAFISVCVGIVADYALALQKQVLLHAVEKARERAGSIGDVAAPKHMKGSLAHMKSILFIFAFIAVGSTYYLYWDDAVDNLVDAIYLSVITMTTVGYGDFSPQNQWGRVFGIFWLLLAVTVLGNFMTDVGSLLMPDEDDTAEEFTSAMESMFNKPLTMEDLRKMGGADHQVDKFEFTAYIISSSKNVNIDEKTIEQIRDKFNELDADRSGVLTMEDLDQLKDKE